MVVKQTTKGWVMEISKDLTWFVRKEMGVFYCYRSSYGDDGFSLIPVDKEVGIYGLASLHSAIQFILKWEGIQ